MKRFILFLSLCTSALFTHSVMADSYWGVKGAMVNTDNSAYSSAINAGAYIGVDFAEIGANPVSIEADLNTTLVKGDVSSLKWGTQTTALYAAMRTGDQDFFKFKIGFHNTTTTVDASSGTSDGLSYGIGFGINNYEIEYTILKGKTSSDSDINLISVGYRFE